jgi:hypothetical protein
MSTTWKEIFEQLTKIVPKGLENHRLQFLFSSPKTGNVNRQLTQDIQFFSDLQKPHLSEVESTIAEWKIGTPFRTLAPDTAFWLFARCQSALAFVMLHSITKDAGGIVFLPPPECSTEDAIKFLLTTWWKKHGLGLFYHELIAQSSVIRDEPDSPSDLPPRR